MSDNTDGQKEEVVETPQEPMPSAQESQEEVPTSQEESQPPVVDEEAEALANSKNPERTKAYIEKLKAQLKDKETPAPLPDTTDYGTSVFDSLRPSAPQVAPAAPQGYGVLNPNQVENIAQNYIDEAGNVDVNGLNQALARSNYQAQQALAEARANREQIIRFEETQQTREAHKDFPQLDPLNKQAFDPVFFKLVKGMITEDLVSNNGQQKTSLAQAAKEVSRYYTPHTSKVQETPEQVQAREKSRVQGPIETGKGATRQDAQSYDDLRTRTRASDPRALDQRLKNLGIIKD